MLLSQRTYIGLAKLVVVLSLAAGGVAFSIDHSEAARILAPSLSGEAPGFVGSLQEKKPPTPKPTECGPPPLPQC
jgi:hypothetical protein